MLSIALEDAWVLCRNIVPPDRRLECFHTRVVLLHLSLTIYDILSYLCKIIMLLRACLTTATPNLHLPTSYTDAYRDWATFITLTQQHASKLEIDILWLWIWHWHASTFNVVDIAYLFEWHVMVSIGNVNGSIFRVNYQETRVQKRAWCRIT